MHKKTHMHDLDIPKDDIDCWERYPKYKWVYDLSRILDIQGIKWSLWKTNELTRLENNISLFSLDNVPYESSSIYVSKPDGNETETEVFIVKGEIKLIRHLNDNCEMFGATEIRISAFISMHFHKFTGVITFRTINNDIFGISLMPKSEYALETNIEISKLFRRIYKKSNVDISGLSDQVLH